MSIDRNSYEAWLLDWQDGNLNPQQTRELFVFFALNPDLLEDLSLDLTEIQLKPEPIEFIAKDDLKREQQVGFVNEENVENYIISSVEDQLTQVEKLALTAFLDSNPSYQRDMAIYRQVELVPDERVVYDNKNELKRENKVVPLYFRFAIAASVILLLGFGLYLSRQASKHESELIAAVDQTQIPNSNISTKTAIDLSQNAVAEELTPIDLEVHNPIASIKGENSEKLKQTIEIEQVQINHSLLKAHEEETLLVSIESFERLNTELVLTESSNEIANNYQPKVLTMRQYVVGKVKQKISTESDKEKLTQEDVVLALTDKGENWLQRKIGFINRSGKDNVAFSLSIGKLEFSLNKARN